MTINLDDSIDSIRSTINGIELVSSQINSYNAANGAFIQANSAQNLVASAFNLANSTTNLVTGAYAEANSALNLSQSAFAQANAGGMTNPFSGTLTVNNLSSNVGLNTGIIVANTRVAINGIDIGTGLSSVYTQSNSNQNLVTGAYANANAALAMSNGFQSIINSVFTLANSTTNLVTGAYSLANSDANLVGGAYGLANTAVQRAADQITGTLTVNNLTSNVAINTNSIVANTRISINGIDIGTGLASVYTLANGQTTSITSLGNLVAGAYNEANSTTNLVGGAYTLANSAVQRTADEVWGTLTVNNLTSNVAINTNSIVANTRISINSIDIGTGLSSNWTSTNSVSNLVTGAYANANAALAMSNGFQSIINSAFTLANSTTNLVTGAYNLANSDANLVGSAYALANTAVQRAADQITGTLTVNSLTSNVGINTSFIVANTTIVATGNVTGGNIVTTGVVNSKSVIINTVNVGGTYVLTANDSGTIICFNNTNTINVNTSSFNTAAIQSGAGYPGFRVVLTQVNTGTVTVVQGPNTLLIPRISGNNSIATINASVSLLVWSSNTYLMDGAMAGGTLATAQLSDIVTATTTTTAGTSNIINAIYNSGVSAFTQANVGVSYPFAGTVTVNNLNSNTGVLAGSMTANSTISAAGNVSVTGPTGYFAGTITTGITAAGITQGAATLLTSQINVITTCSGGSNGVQLPIPPVGAEVHIVNIVTAATAACKVWPPSGHGIDALGLNLGANCAPSGFRKFVLANSNHWYTSANGMHTLI